MYPSAQHARGGPGKQKPQPDLGGSTSSNGSQNPAKASSSGKAHASPIVELNVGGFKFTTSRTTLCGVPGSHLEAMFSGRHAMGAHQTGDGAYFIDRDGSHFRHILNFLRSGTVITLPDEPTAKEELAIEADFYGLDALVKAIRMPNLDVLEFLPEKTLAQWEAEAELRSAFVDGTAKGFCKSDPFHSLVPLFPCGAQEDECMHSMPLLYDPDIKKQLQGTLLLETLPYDSVSTDPTTPVTVKSLGEFQTNFNKEWPNVLHRLQGVLAEEPVIIAGGSVLRALTASEGIRTANVWTKLRPNEDSVPSDIDVFLHGCDKEEAIRIAHRIFNALAGPAEKWAVTRSRGVLNFHHFNAALYRVDVKLQVVLRIYDSPSEVLVGFDIDPCCCTYDGRNVWVCPRWISALQGGVTILNPLHAWPSKPSYEFRLAKYASRGYVVSVPGLEKGRINYDLIHQTPLFKLKGLARLIKIVTEMDSAPPFKTREYADSDDETAEYDDNTECRFHHHSRSRTSVEVENLRKEVARATDPNQGLLQWYDQGYDDPTRNVVIPSNYRVRPWGRYRSWLRQSNFPVSQESREQAWQEILDAGENHPEGVGRCLIDAWDTTKRSREYLNSQMDAYDRNSIYYSAAYNEVKKGD